MSLNLFELKDVKLNLVTFIPKISNQISETAPTNSQKLSPNSNLRIEICSFRTRCRYCKLLRPLDIGLYDNSSCDRRCVLKRVKCSKRFSPYKTRRLNTGVCTLIVRFFKLCNLVKYCVLNSTGCVLFDQMARYIIFFQAL